MYDVLQGIRVIDFSTWLLMPSAGAVLADWGADVIKIEGPDQPDPARGLVVGGQAVGNGFQLLVEFGNRGKRSVAIDVRHAEGLKLLYKLVASADVFITNMRTKATERLGIDVPRLRGVNPDLICVRATGYGQHGLLADRAAFDLSAAWAAGGAAYSATRPDRSLPAFQPGSFGDLTGGLATAGAVAAALLKRERTGASSVIDVALQSVGMWMMGPQITGASLDVHYPAHRVEEPSNPMVNAFQTKDGRWIYFTVMQADRFWESFCTHVGRPELVTDPRFVDATARTAKSAELTKILADVFAAYTLDEWKERLAGFDGVWAPAMAPAEIVVDPQVQANGFLADVEYPFGTRPMVAAPTQFDEKPIGSLRAAPGHGEHTDEVLLELGLSAEEILDHKIAGSVL